MIQIKALSKVDGWLHEKSASIISDILEFQNEQNWAGGIAEIGIHHGKLFLLAASHLKNDEFGYAADLFDDQQQNIDKSGQGDRQIFENHINDLIPDKARAITVHSGNSLDIVPEDILSKFGQVRFFSVDGGHTAECTLNDLSIAQDVLCDYGVVVLDDAFNQAWPDVSTGLADFYYRKSIAKISVFALSPNKVFFCKKEYTKKYRDYLRQKHPELYLKTSTMFDSEMDIYLEPASKRARVARRVKKIIGQKSYDKLRALLKS